MAYPGGKAGPGTYQRIINHMPPHRVYIEPFLGAGAVLRHKRPAEVNIGVELDPDVIAEYHADSRQVLTDRTGDEAFTVDHDDGWPSDSHPGATIVHGDGIPYLRERQWQGDELVYCDPPYMRGSRTGGPLYNCEMSEEQHRELLAVLNALRAAGVQVMISGYQSKLYARELKGWTLITFGSMTRRGMALEHLWMSFPDPVELHDYRYLGEDYRERERIKKKVRRWTARLEGMPKLERQALMAAMTEVDLTAEAA